MSKRIVTPEDQKHIQIEMMDEIDAFCRSHNIRYSLAFGTLLGAIRHNGFIPWDDDLDIIMPLPDMLRFKAEFKSEIMRYYDVDNCRYHQFAFSRIEYLKTYSETGGYKGPGVCIDLYIMVGLPDSDKEEKSYFTKCNKLLNQVDWCWRADAMFRRKYRLPGFPFAHYLYKKKRDTYLSVPDYESSNRFYAIAGPIPLRDKMTYCHDMFADMKDVLFEGKKYMAIADFDEFLTLRYGDYMQLPPEDQRHPYHCFTHYWK